MNCKSKPSLENQLIHQSDDFEYTIRMHHYQLPNTATTTGIHSIQNIIEMFYSLSDPDTHIFNTLKMINDELSKFTNYDIPEDCFIIIGRFFLSLDQINDSEEDYTDDDSGSSDTSTVLEYTIRIIFSLVKTNQECLKYFLAPEIIIKLFSFYDKLSCSRSFINYLAQNYNQFIIQYRENIINILNTEPFSDSKAELLFQVLKFDNNFISFEKFFEKIDNALLHKKDDTNLYSVSLDILASLLMLNPKEIIPNIIPKMPYYINMDGDSIDNYNILNLYHNLLLHLHSFNNIVNDYFINFMIKVISTEIDCSVQKSAFEILLLEYDLSPFLPYSIFFQALLDKFDCSTFIIQRYIVIFVSKIMQICNLEGINYFMKCSIIENISSFLTVDDEDLISYVLLIIYKITNINSKFEWPDETIDIIEALSLNSNQHIAQIAQGIKQKLYQ